MWHSAMRIASRLRRRRRGGPQSGSGLIATIALTGILALLVIASLSYARSTTTQTAREGRGDIALEAADAGINRYISRLVEDPRYYDHWIDTAEDPRIDPSGVVHAAGHGVDRRRPVDLRVRPAPDLGQPPGRRASAPPPTRCASSRRPRVGPGDRAVDRPVRAASSPSR